MIGDKGAVSLAEEMKSCTQLTSLDLDGEQCGVAVAAIATGTQVLFSHGCHWLCSTGNDMTEEGYTALLTAAVKGPAFEWIRNSAHALRQPSLVAAGLPRELDYNPTGIVSYLRQLHKGSGNRRASLILIGPQAVGKSSLLWRLLHPDKGDKLPDFQSTNGIANGAML